MFIPQRISNISEIRQKIEKILYASGNADENGQSFAGLFGTGPFSQFKDKFNVFYVDRNIDENYFSCYLETSDPSAPPKWNMGHGCDDGLIKKAYKIFNPDYIAVLFDLPPGYHSTGGEIQYLEANNPSLVFTFVHEFGHQFGGLADEYITTSSPAYNCGSWENETPPMPNIAAGNVVKVPLDYNCFANYLGGIAVYPNLDTLGCPKWCKSYDLNKLLAENELCGEIRDENECAAKNDGGICTWFKTKHPFLNTNCVRTQGYENIGINCTGNSQCVIGGDYGQLAFNPGISIMGGGTKFNQPSENHLANILQCCYPRKNDDACNSFRNKFSNPSQSANYYLKIAYRKIVDCQ